MEQKSSAGTKRLISAIRISLLIAFLFSACSGTATVEQPTSPTVSQDVFTPTVNIEVPPSPTVQASPTIEPTVEPTVENTATPIPPTPTITPTEGPTIGSTRVSEIDQMVQVYVPAGEFLMGSDDPEAKRTIEGGRAYPEIPQHTVYLDSYWIDKFEVTTSQYALCVAAGICRAPWETSSYTYANYYGNPEYANYPVIWVNWYMARDYCTWVGRRLPTEAEWEKAARGTDGAMYPWGNDELSGERANFCDINCTRSIANDRYDDGYPDVAPVGSYPAGASPYGAMDMSGNVWEWVSSLIMPYPYDANDGREDPDSTAERAWRGGPWSNGYWWMRSSVRYRSVSNYWWYVLGFRCASSE
ncbi:MAG: formylglycine-generating enzyme family protein [Anaerolineales bacterium]|nr:formylglycine-generating enzyme family protein [Anaerolineales bacterium]